MFYAATGQYEGVDAKVAALNVIEQCVKQLGHRQPQAGILFSAGHFDQKTALTEVMRTFPGIELVGCSTGGEMSSALGFSMESMCLMLFTSDTIQFSTGMGHDVSANPEKAMAEAVEAALPRLEGPPALALLFPAPAQRGIERLIPAAKEILGPDCPVFGGLAAYSSFGPSTTYQFFKDEVHTDAVSILLLSGPVAIASTVCNSWTPVGSQFNVTESNQNKVKRIGCSTALDFYRKAFGPYSVPLPEMPLMVYGEDGSFTIRVPHDHDEDDGSIMFTTPISESSRVQLTEATPRAIVKDISDNVQALTDSQPSTWSPQAAILLSCTSRLWILGQRTKEEIETATRLLPQGLPLIGFYTFGELATAPEPQLHNCTLVVLLLGEQDNTASPLPVTHHPGEQIDDSKALLRRKFKRSEEGRARLEQQKEFFTNVMRQTNADLESANKKIHDQHQILKESITLAQGVQRRLLPKEQPEIEGYDIAGFSIYCDETGGDYIDYLPDGNGLGVVIGDVSGHGVASALLMASTRAFLRMRVSMGGTPAQYLTDINQMIAKDVLETGRFVTMQYLHLDPDTRQVTWARAGHEPALHYSPEDNRFTEFRGEGLTLGVLEDSTYEDHTTPAMKPGEIIILSTDGITEVQDHQGRLFGRNRLQDIIQKNGTKSAQEILQLCKDELQAFRGDENRADDETLVIIKVS